MPEQRPNPEELLQRVQAEEQKITRGKLKIYLGAAPGVGKTYEMLHDALEEREKGLDVVIGIVESHGRVEINKLAKNFENLPREKILYHGKELFEFDLDGALKRNPALILIDEMAHTNAPLMRHKKRWQDIKELLDRGVDVYTTLNVQHIESLNDDVSQIIHAPIQETVPDSMLELADTIELIDIPPKELLKRLNAGKVYIPEQAKLASEYFFKEGNLTALRELALRTTAEQVGSQVLLYRQGKGIKHIWPTKEKILVCVGAGSESRKLIRAARRLATSLQIDWIAVVVETPKLRWSEAKHNKAIQNLRFAAQLGATTRILTGLDMIKEIMRFAREQNVTQIMVWKNIRPRIRNLFFRNLADEIVRHSGEIDVYIMTGNVKTTASPEANDLSVPSTSWLNYFLGILIVTLVTGLNFFLQSFLSTSNLIMVYLLGVTLVALLGEVGPAMLASILSVLACDFFFIEPLYSFAVSDIEYFFTLLVMLVVSFIISHLTLRMQKQAESARFAEQQTAALHTLSRQLASTRGMDKILEIGTHYLGDILNSEVSALLPSQGRLVLHPKNKELKDKEQGIAKWVYEMGKNAGFGTDTLSFSNALYIPLIASQQTIGVLRIVPKTKRLFTPDQMYLLEACSNQIALALEVDKIHT
jgi:two-component system sensor histidine kinase KdpD